MLYRLRNSTRRAWHRWLCRDIKRTPCLETRPGDLIFLSMVSHRDVLMYLAAIKSVYARIGEGEVVILDDGSLRDSDIALIEAHIRSPRFIHADTVDVGRCPHGGCWERLVTAMELCERSYVIQLDSDTLALGEIPEVLKAYKENRSFLLGTRNGRVFIPLVDVPKLTAGIASNHVQIVAERNFPKIPNSETLRYARGSAGFAGYASRKNGRELIERFSADMSAIIGNKWREWGSEQVASNFVIANTWNSIVLPYPKYACHDPELDLNKSSFVHFFGTYRFHRNKYSLYTRKFIIGQADSCDHFG